MKKAKKTCDFQCELNNDLKYLKFQVQNEVYKATPIDLQGYEIINGYDGKQAEALSDLHSNLF
jgi:hypothetical protein